MRFKAGDKVRCISIGAHEAEVKDWATEDGRIVGGVYEVCGVAPSSGWVRLRSGGNYIHPTHFELIMKFKAGDKVRCISVGASEGESRDWATQDGCVIGGIYQVYHIAPGSNLVKLSDDGYAISLTHFELVKEEEIMMHSKKLEWIINYLNEKNKILKDAARVEIPDLTNTADIIDLCQWNEEHIEESYKIIRKTLKSGCSDSSGGLLCPWCIKKGMGEARRSCDDCTFGTRHGECNEYESTFSKIEEGLNQLKIGNVLDPHAQRLLNLDPEPEEEKEVFLFSDAKAGDKVYTEQWGPGVIRSINMDRSYPLIVKFTLMKNSLPESFTFEGKYRKSDYMPILKKGEGPEPVEEFYEFKHNNGHTIKFKLKPSAGFPGGMTLRAHDSNGKVVTAGHIMTIAPDGSMRFQEGINEKLKLWQAPK